jgi:hypothetical protein
MRVYAGLWAATLGFAALVWLTPGAGSLARGVLRLSLSAAHNPPPSLGGALSIAANNVVHSAWPLSLGLIDAQRRPFTRLLADGAVFANLLVAALLVGGAVGGYGVQALAFLPHVPLEWAGIAVGAAGWAVERERPLDWRARVLGLALTAVLLGCAAVVESCLVPHR